MTGVQAELLTAALDGITSQEITGLTTLSSMPPQSAGEDRPSARAALNDSTTTGELVAEAVVARLVGRGLILVDPPGFGGFGVTPLGDQVVEALKGGDRLTAPPSQ